MKALNKQLVLENNVIFGTMNANLRHYRAAVEALARAERPWLEGIVSRRVPLADWRQALIRQPNDVKPVISSAEPRARPGRRNLHPEIFPNRAGALVFVRPPT